MPLPRAQVALAAPVAVVATHEEAVPLRQPLPAETPIASPVPDAIIPDVLPPSTPECKTDTSHSSAEDPDLQTIETELEQVFELPQLGLWVIWTMSGRTSARAISCCGSARGGCSRNRRRALVADAPVVLATVQAEFASPAVPEFVSASQPVLVRW